MKLTQENGVLVVIGTPEEIAKYVETLNELSDKRQETQRAIENAKFISLLNKSK